MNIDQLLAQLAQRLQRHRLAVDEGARAPIARDDHAPQDAFAVAFDRLRLEPAPHRPRSRDVEGRGDLGALGAVAHDFAAGATAGGEQQRIDDDGFARAGFAGEHGQTGAELELELIDDREVANLQIGQQASALAQPLSGAGCTVDRRGPSAVSSAASGSSRIRADAAA